jgi:hypothetical protein
VESVIGWFMAGLGVGVFVMLALSALARHSFEEMLEEGEEMNRKLHTKNGGPPRPWKDVAGD